MQSFRILFASVLAAVAGVQAEMHTVRFENHCGRGTPTLVRDGKILSKGQPFTSNGPLISAIAYLQDGNCGLNGEQCTLIETTLKNPTPGQPGSGSSTDISLIPPHKFNVAAGFHYAGPCHGGKECKEKGCKEAFHTPPETGKQVACQKDNADLVITFC